ncbi:hypothetical protein [Paraferrimonas sp. SM1919]
MKKTTFDGADLWTCFEISWLNPKGKPLIDARFQFLLQPAARSPVV